MAQGIVEDIVSKEIDRYYHNVFSEFKTDILLGKNKIINIYLGFIERFVPDRYTKPEEMYISDEKRRVKIKVETINQLITKEWVEKGFEFFKEIKENYICIKWENIKERIYKYQNKPKDLSELVRDYQLLNKKEFLSVDDLPSIAHFDIWGYTSSIQKFIVEHKSTLDFSEAILESSLHHKYDIKVDKNLLDFDGLGTNANTKEYARLVDKFLEEVN